MSNLYRKYLHWLKWENFEQANLVLRLEINWYKFTSIPNSTRSKSYKQNTMNTLTWLRAWLCDIMIILKRWSLLFIEMKRPWKVLKSWKLWKTPSVISEQQLEWIDNLNCINNVSAEIAYWYIDAINIIKKYENL